MTGKVKRTNYRNEVLYLEISGNRESLDEQVKCFNEHSSRFHTGATYELVDVR